LFELNLINFIREESYDVEPKNPDRLRITLRVGSRYLTIEQDGQDPKLSFPAMSFTSIGRELFKLHVPGVNPDFETTLADVLQTAGFRVHWAAHLQP
jgi:hypothetical protein